MVERITIDVDASGPIRMLRAAIDAVEPPKLTQAIRAGAKVLARGMQARAPKRTGRLAHSVAITPESDTEMFVGPDQGLPYAGVQEYGATIRPVRARSLRFFVGSELVFARKVVVPAHPYVAPTFAADGERALDTVADRIERAVLGAK